MNVSRYLRHGHSQTFDARYKATQPGHPSRGQCNEYWQWFRLDHCMRRNGGPLPLGITICVSGILANCMLAYLGPTLAGSEAKSPLATNLMVYV